MLKKDNQKIHFNIITLFPELFNSYLNFSVLGKGKEKNGFSYSIFDLRDYGIGGYNKVDDYPYGGSKGMVIRCEPVSEILDKIENRGKVIYLSPKGRTLNQKIAKSYSYNSHITLLCGRYEGIDQRLIDLYVDEEISLGDFILTGSELPALCFIDSVCRHLPNVLDEEAIVDESFNNNLLEHPHYTRPACFKGLDVPEILLSGHHANIHQWRQDKKIEITKRSRPDLYKKYLEENK